MAIYRQVHPLSTLDQPRGKEWNEVHEAAAQENPPLHQCSDWRKGLQPIATRTKKDLWDLKKLNDSRTAAPRVSAFRSFDHANGY